MNQYYRYEDGIPFPYVGLPAPGDPLDDLTLLNVLGPLLHMMASTARCAYESHRDDEIIGGALALLQEQAESTERILQRWKDSRGPKSVERLEAFRRGDAKQEDVA